jgi:hypothetical protein
MALGAHLLADSLRQDISKARAERALCNDPGRQMELDERIRAAEREIVRLEDKAKALESQADQDGQWRQSAP